MATRHGPTVKATKDSQSIVFEGKVVLTIHENHKGFPAGSPGPIVLQGVSPDRKWILYAIDPQGSASLMADGLTTLAVRARGGRSYTVASGLGYGAYRTWCGNRLVVTAGGDRIASNDKRLVVTGPPAWKPHVLADGSTRAYGSVVCAPDGTSVVVQEQPESVDGNFFHTKWRLWRVRLDGRHRALTAPPAGYADESPRFAPDGTLYFVRSTRGVGKLYALRNGKLVGPLLSLGYSLGYYGHQDWPYTVTR